jgi:hypothetical protein
VNVPRGKSLDQVKAMQRKAVRFVSDVLGDPDKAEEIDDLSVEEYADRKGIRLNPTQSKEANIMAATTKQALQDTLDEASTKVEEMLNPTLTRKELVILAQELDEILNGSDDQEDDEEEEDDDE